MRTVKIRPTQPQADFHALQCKHPAFVGGFGTGKSETMANQAFMDASHSADALIGLYEPTYDLVRLIMAPRMEEKLQQYGVRYKYNKSENIIYTSNGQLGDFILRTLDNPSRIIGYETYRAHVDELDTLKEDKALEAWIKIIARNRQSPAGISAPFNRVGVYTTPEGFKFVYKYWKKSPREGYEMIQASTLSNPFLPPDYVDTLKNTYPSNLIEAYINGEFTNLTSGIVYHQFDRKLNNSTETIETSDVLHIGMDFNVGKMSAVTHVQRGDFAHAVDETMGAFDTPEMIRLIQDKYWEYDVRSGKYIQKHKIYIYPDSSGNNRKSVNASETDLTLLRNAGFTVIVDGANPRVRDRINAVNAMFCNANNERRYFINGEKCPLTVEAFEQQAYNKNGEPDKANDTDHPIDAAGYFIAKKYTLHKPFTPPTIRIF